jgi:thiol-disulfide isomerase/thioredoxin
VYLRRALIRADLTSPVPDTFAIPLEVQISAVEVIRLGLLEPIEKLPMNTRTVFAACLFAALNICTFSARAESVASQADRNLPSLSGAVEWINSPPLTPEALKGKVVLVDFWTYDCINCRRSLPYVNQWAKQYAKDGLVVIGVHTPEYGYEKIIDNVRNQVKKLGIDYPVAVDSNYTIWRAFDNQFWPAHYFFDATGKARYSHFGEGRYEAQEKVIQALLEEARAGGV